MAMNYVLVPSTGFLYFNHYIMDEENDCKFVLVPSTGFLYFNKQKNDKRNICDYVLVPSTGFLYFNVSFKKRQINTLVKFSSPPRGSYISILSLTPLQTQGFHPPFAGQTRKWEKSQYQTGSYRSQSLILSLSAQNCYISSNSILPIPIWYSFPWYFVHLQTCGASLSCRSLVCLCTT